MQTDVARKVFNVDEYYKMLDSGIVHEGDRIELIAGEILQMSSMGARHAGVLSRAGEELSVSLSGKAVVRIQLPIRVNAWSEPEPDIAVIRYDAGHYKNAHPGPADVLFLIEIADTTLRFDMDVKLPIYAESGVPEVWIVDLDSAVLSTYSDPIKSAYRSRTDLHRGDSVKSLAHPNLDFPVSSILP